MKVYNKWLVALLFLGVMSLYGCSLPIVTKLKARDYLNKGATQYTNKKYDAAAQFFQKSLELDPTFEIARMYLASAYMSQYMPGSTDPRNEQIANLAIETFKEVVAKSEAAGTPDINAMISIASLYSLMKNLPASKEWCDRVLKIEPNNAEASYRVAVMNYDVVSEKTGLQGRYVKDLTEDEIEDLKGKIEEGLSYIGRALKARENYHEAMEYQNYLWREKANLETDEKAKGELLRQADMVALESLKIRRKAQEEAARRPKAAPKK